ncbi:hypothetical protein ACVFYP_08600 [Roseomonas sp. F4]
MSTTPAILAVLLTLVAGIACGLLFLQRIRRPLLVLIHLVLALTATALVAWLVLLTPGGRGGGPPAWLPLALLALALIAGWSARRLPRGARRGANALLASHVFAGIAGFLVLLAWVRPPG